MQLNRSSAALDTLAHTLHRIPGDSSPKALALATATSAEDSTQPRYDQSSESESQLIPCAESHSHLLSVGHPPLSPFRSASRPVQGTTSLLLPATLIGYLVGEGSMHSIPGIVDGQ